MSNPTPRKTPGEVDADRFIEQRRRGTALGYDATAEFHRVTGLTIHVVDAATGAAVRVGTVDELTAFFDGVDGTAPRRILLGETPAAPQDDHRHHLVVADTVAEAEQVADALDDDALRLADPIVVVERRIVGVRPADARGYSLNAYPDPLGAVVGQGYTLPRTPDPLASAAGNCAAARRLLLLVADWYADRTPINLWPVDGYPCAAGAVA